MVTEKLGIIERVTNYLFAGTGGDAADPLTELLGSNYTDQGGSGPTTLDNRRPATTGFIDNYFIHKKPVGSMGTESYAGYPREEYLHELFGKDRAKIYDRMRRSDAQIKMLLGAVKNPIKAAVWEVEPASDHPDDVRRADVIRHILFDDMADALVDGVIKITGFQKFVEEALTCVDFGHAVFEKTFRLVKNHPKYGFYHGIAGLDLISAKTIYRWNLAPNGGLKSITQLAVGDLHRYINLPAQFLIPITLEQEGANWEGIGFLRACYGSFIRKNLLLKLNIIGAERFAIGTPIAKIPDGFQNTAQYAFLVSVLEALTSGESAYTTIPKSVELEMGKNQFDPEKIISAVLAEDTMMACAFLANFLELGKGGATGNSNAMSETLMGFFLGGIEHVGHKIAAMVNMLLIPELCNLNFGPLPAYPKLKVTGISDKAGKELSEVLRNLTQANVVEPDDLLEEQIRKRYGFTKKSEIGRRQAPMGPNAGFIGPDGQVITPAAPGGDAGENKFSLTQRIRRRLYG